MPCAWCGGDLLNGLENSAFDRCIQIGAPDENASTKWSGGNAATLDVIPKFPRTNTEVACPLVDTHNNWWAGSDFFRSGWVDEFHASFCATYRLRRRFGGLHCLGCVREFTHRLVDWVCGFISRDVARLTLIVRIAVKRQAEAIFFKRWK